MAKVLITGGSGFLGMNAIPELLKAGHEVTNLSLQASALQVKDVLFNALEDDLNTALNGEAFDFVIHLAAYASPKLSADYDKTMALNVDFTERLLKQAAQWPNLKKFYFFSTATAYADSAPRPLKEESDLQANEGDNYALSKIKGEALCKTFMKQGLAVNIWRLTNCYGPYQAHSPHPNLVPQIMKEAIQEKQITILNGKYSRDFLFSGDFARILVQSMDMELPAIMNVATGNPHTVNEIAEYVSQRQNVAVHDKQVDIQKARDLTLDVSLFKDHFPGFTFTPFNESLEKSLEYYLKVL